MILNFHIPEYPTRNFISSIICYEGYTGSSNFEMLLPDGNPRLIITLDDNPRYSITSAENTNKLTQLSSSWITGFLSRPIIYLSEENASTISVQFEAYGLAHLLKVPANEINNQLLDPELISSTGLGELREKLILKKAFKDRIALLETFFLKKLSNIEFRSSIKEVIMNFGTYDQVTLKSLSVEHKYSQKHILSEFKKAIGTTPKKLQTLNRINRAIKLLNEPRSIPFAQIAYSCGFYDQTHFIKKFKEVTLMTPGAYTKKNKSYPHVINFD